MNNLSFDYKKAVQAINFFATRNNGCITKLEALKLIFFADRYHLRKFGRPITNDQYWAMQFGPVASAVKELAELDSLGKERHYAEAYLKQMETPHELASIQAVDEDVFSDSDIEALSFVWNTFGPRLHHLVNITHQYPEWKKHESALKSGQSRVRMDLMDFLEDPPPGVEPCCLLSDEEKQHRREALMHLNAIETLWR